MDIKPPRRVEPVRPVDREVETQRSVNQVSTPTNSQKQRKKGFRKPSRRVLIIGAVIAVIVAVGLFFLVQFLTAPARITSVEFRRALSSRTTDAPVAETFKVKDPIMVMFTYEAAKPNTTATAILQRDDKAVRTIELPYLRAADSTVDKGTRFISLVNGESTKLDAGKYTLVIKSGDRTLSEKKLTIE